MPLKFPTTSSEQPPTEDTRSYFQRIAPPVLRVGGQIGGAALGGFAGALGGPPGVLAGGIVGGAAGGGAGELLAELIENGYDPAKVSKLKVALEAGLGAVPGQALIKGGKAGVSALRSGLFAEAGNVMRRSVEKADRGEDWKVRPTVAELKSDVLPMVLGAGMGGLVGGLSGRGKGGAPSSAEARPVEVKPVSEEEILQKYHKGDPLTPEEDEFSKKVADQQRRAKASTAEKMVEQQKKAAEAARKETERVQAVKKAAEDELEAKKVIANARATGEAQPPVLTVSHKAKILGGTENVLQKILQQSKEGLPGAGGKSSRSPRLLKSVLGQYFDTEAEALTAAAGHPEAEVARTARGPRVVFRGTTQSDRLVMPKKPAVVKPDASTAKVTPSTSVVASPASQTDQDVINQLLQASKKPAASSVEKATDIGVLKVGETPTRGVGPGADPRRTSIPEWAKNLKVHVTPEEVVATRAGYEKALTELEASGVDTRELRDLQKRLVEAGDNYGQVSTGWIAAGKNELDKPYVGGYGAEAGNMRRLFEKKLKGLATPPAPTLEQQLQASLDQVKPPVEPAAAAPTVGKKPRVVKVKTTPPPPASEAPVVEAPQTAQTASIPAPVREVVAAPPAAAAVEKPAKAEKGKKGPLSKVVATVGSEITPTVSTAGKASLGDRWRAIVAELDSKNAVDADYKSILPSGSSNNLRAGETWRSRALKMARMSDETASGATPGAALSSGKKLSGESGSISPDLLNLLTRGGMTAAGALAGYATDPNDPLTSTLVGGAAGFGGGALVSKLLQSGGGGVNSKKLLDAVGTAGRQLPNLQRTDLLSGPSSLTANAFFGPWAGSLLGAVERFLTGKLMQATGKAAEGGELAAQGAGGIRNNRNPITFSKGLFKNYEEAGKRLQRAEGGIERAGSGGWSSADTNSPLGIAKSAYNAPAQMMTAGDLQAEQGLLAAGWPRSAAERTTLRGEAVGPTANKIQQMFKGKNDQGLLAVLGDMMLPFKRTTANVWEQGLERTPVIGSIYQHYAKKMKADPWQQQFIQQGLGATIWLTTEQLGENTDPETAKWLRKFVSNAGGQYSAVANAGFMAGQAVRAGKGNSWVDLATHSAKSLLNGAPLPAADLPLDYITSLGKIMNEGLILSGDDINIPRGMRPGIIYNNDLPSPSEFGSIISDLLGPQPPPSGAPGLNFNR